MVVYVWLSLIDRMVTYSSLEDYHESKAYTKHGDSMIVMVERNTPIWKEE